MRRPVAIAPGRAALLCVDLQEEHRQDPRYLVAAFDTLLANVGTLQRAARASAIPVRHSAYVLDATVRARKPLYPAMPNGAPAFSEKGSPLSEICAEVGPVNGEAVFIKSDAGAFDNDLLERELREDGAEWLFLAGVWTEACIAATAKQAIDHGFRIVLVKDACGSGSQAMHQTAILNLANRLYGGAVTDTAGACRLMAGETIEAWVLEGSVPLRFSYEDAADLYAGL